MLNGFVPSSMCYRLLRLSCADEKAMLRSFDKAVLFESPLKAAKGVEVLFDDRPKVSPGVKFKDAELLGMPFALILGRSFADGIVELRIRGGETLEIPADEAVARIQELVRG